MGYRDCGRWFSRTPEINESCCGKSRKEGSGEVSDLRTCLTLRIIGTPISRVITPVTKFIRPFIRVITPFITTMGPPCIYIPKNQRLDPPKLRGWRPCFSQGSF